MIRLIDAEPEEVSVDDVPATQPAVVEHIGVDPVDAGDDPLSEVFDDDITKLFGELMAEFDDDTIQLLDELMGQFSSV